MVENDAVNVSAYVRIYKDPTGVLWHNFIKSVFHCVPIAHLSKSAQLQFEKGDWDGRPQESGRNMLPEFLASIIILYKCLPKGEVYIHSRIPLLTRLGCLPNTYRKRIRTQNVKQRMGIAETILLLAVQ